MWLKKEDEPTVMWNSQHKYAEMDCGEEGGADVGLPNLLWCRPGFKVIQGKVEKNNLWNMKHEVLDKKMLCLHYTSNKRSVFYMNFTVIYLLIHLFFYLFIHFVFVLH